MNAFDSCATCAITRSTFQYESFESFVLCANLSRVVRNYANVFFSLFHISHRIVPILRVLAIQSGHIVEQRFLAIAVDQLTIAAGASQMLGPFVALASAALMRLEALVFGGAERKICNLNMMFKYAHF